MPYAQIKSMTPAQIKWELERFKAERDYVLDVLSGLVDACNSLAPYAPVSQLQQCHAVARATEAVARFKAKKDGGGK
jgi:hypothetical protein